MELPAPGMGTHPEPVGPVDTAPSCDFCMSLYLTHDKGPLRVRGNCVRLSFGESYFGESSPVRNPKTLNVDNLSVRALTSV